MFFRFYSSGDGTRPVRIPHFTIVLSTKSIYFYFNSFFVANRIILPPYRSGSWKDNPALNAQRYIAFKYFFTAIDRDQEQNSFSRWKLCYSTSTSKEFRQRVYIPIRSDETLNLDGDPFELDGLGQYQG